MPSLVSISHCAGPISRICGPSVPSLVSISHCAGPISSICGPSVPSLGSIPDCAGAISNIRGRPRLSIASAMLCGPHLVSSETPRTAGASPPSPRSESASFWRLGRSQIARDSRDKPAARHRLLRSQGEGLVSPPARSLGPVQLATAEKSHLRLPGERSDRAPSLSAERRGTEV